MLPLPRFLNLAETLLMEPTAAPARVMFRDNLALPVPFWEEARQAAEQHPELVARATSGPDEDTPPDWWEPDNVIAARQRLLLVREYGAALPQEA